MGCMAGAADGLRGALRTEHIKPNKLFSHCEKLFRAEHLTVFVQWQSHTTKIVQRHSRITVFAT
jgi:hypothetical protein